MSLSFTFCSEVKDSQSSLLWEISGNGLEEPSYIYGTIHITCDASLKESIHQAMDKTERLFLELDMDDPNMGASLSANIKMKNGKSLKDYTTHREYEMIKTFMDEYSDESLAKIDSLKPMMISMYAIPGLLDCPIESFELELMNLAHEQGKEVWGLETVEEQLKVFDDIPYEIQVKDLLRSVRDDLEQDKEELQKMLVAHKNENLKDILDIIQNSSALYISEYREIILEDRNLNWIPKISEAAKTKPSFFAVGAGHLPGDMGVIALLRKHGYTVKAVY